MKTRLSKGPGMLSPAYFYAGLFALAVERAKNSLEGAEAYRRENNLPGQRMKLEWARKHGARARQHYASLQSFMESGVGA